MSNKGNLTPKLPEGIQQFQFAQVVFVGTHVQTIFFAMFRPIK